MIILLYGPDSYRRREKLKEYAERYKAKYQALSLRHFYFNQEDDWNNFRDFSRSQSLFEVSKLGIISKIDELEDKNQKEFAKILKENLKSKDLTLIIESDKKPVKEFNFLLKEPAIAHEFENLDSAKFLLFVKESAGRLGVKLDSAGAFFLAKVFIGDSWGLVTELEKLSLLSEKNVTEPVLRTHLDVLGGINLFTALEVMRGSGRLAERLKAFEELLFRNQDPAMLFNRIAVAPYEGRNWKESMADYDVAIKSGKLEYEEVLLDIVLK